MKEASRKSVSGHEPLIRIQLSQGSTGHGGPNPGRRTRTCRAPKTRCGPGPTCGLLAPRPASSSPRRGRTRCATRSRGPARPRPGPRTVRRRPVRRSAGGTPTATSRRTSRRRAGSRPPPRRGHPGSSRPRTGQRSACQPGLGQPQPSRRPGTSPPRASQPGTSQPRTSQLSGIPGGRRSGTSRRPQPGRWARWVARLARTARTRTGTRPTSRPRSSCPARWPRGISRPRPLPRPATGRASRTRLRRPAGRGQPSRPDVTAQPGRPAGPSRPPARARARRRPSPSRPGHGTPQILPSPAVPGLAVRTPTGTVIRSTGPSRTRPPVCSGPGRVILRRHSRPRKTRLSCIPHHLPLAGRADYHRPGPGRRPSATASPAGC